MAWLLRHVQTDLGSVFSIQSVCKSVKNEDQQVQGEAKHGIIVSGSLSTYTLFACADVLVEDLGTLDTDEVQATFFGNSGSQKCFTTTRITVE